MLTFLIIQIFWLLFIAIGTAAWLAARRRTNWPFQERLVPAGEHPLVAVVIAFAFGLVVFVPFIVVAYIFELPLSLIVGLYLCLTAGSLMLLMRDRGTIAAVFKTWLPNWQRLSKTWPVLVVIAAILTFDYATASLTKGRVDYDTPVPIAKINQLVSSNRISFTDPFLSMHELVDVRYSANTLNALYAVGAKLSRSDALTIWTHSYAFFRLMIWLALFSLVWVFTAVPQRKRWAYTALALLPFLKNEYFAYIQLPDRVVLIWTALFLVGFKLWLERRRPAIIIAATILIATTHALNALMTLGFVGLVAAGLAITRAGRAKDWRLFAVLAVILLVPILHNLYYPSHLAKSPLTFDAGAISQSYELQHIGGVALARLPPIGWTFLGASILLLLVSYRVYRLRLSHQIKLVFAGLFCIIAGLLYLPTLMSLIMYGYLYRATRHKAVKICLVLLVIYYGLLIYNPVFMTLAEDKVPPWLIARFSEFNLLAILASILGPLVMLESIFPKKIFPKIYRWLLAATPVFILALITFTYPLLLNGPVSPGSARLNNSNIADLRRLRQFAPELRGRRVLSNERDVLTKLPMIAETNPVYMNPTNMTPVANTVIRAGCYDALMRHFALADLQAAGVTRVLVSKTYEADFDRLVASKSYAQLLQTSGDYSLYGIVAEAENRTENGVCHIPLGQ